jgi:7,8-dihydro-6-hydroxymethylpterin-pyrophosphokinase
LLLTIVTLGQNIRDEMNKRKQQLKEIEKTGDIDVYPFFRKQDYEEQLKTQPFLNGQRKANAQQ